MYESISSQKELSIESPDNLAKTHFLGDNLNYSNFKETEVSLAACKQFYPGFYRFELIMVDIKIFNDPLTPI